MLIAGGFDFGGHAEERAIFWGIHVREVEQALMNPQRKYRKPDGKLAFVRRIRRGRLPIEVLVDDFSAPPLVVTVYP
jgi:hypothetical protein